VLLAVPHSALLVSTSS